jgi:hypothetical protein
MIYIYLASFVEGIAVRQLLELLLPITLVMAWLCLVCGLRNSTHAIARAILWLTAAVLLVFSLVVLRWPTGLPH